MPNCLGAKGFGRGQSHEEEGFMSRSRSDQEKLGSSGHAPAALITGSSGGIGQALIEAFSDHGYFTIGLDRKETSGADVCIKADLSDFEDSTIESRMGEILTHRPLQVLVNNAAVQKLGTIRELTVDDFRHTLDVNLISAFRLIKFLFPYLEGNGGSVINIGSIHRRLTKPRFSAYATSKGALEALTRALAVELGSRLRVNAISPAAVETPMLKSGFAGSSKSYQRLASCHPSGRIAQPSDVANVAVFLASEKARSINGAIVDVDGGIGGRLHDPE